MRKRVFLGFIAAAMFIFTMSGCLAIANTPNSRFYMLNPINKVQASGNSGIAAEMIIEVGPVGIPAYLNRPQIVTTNKNGTLNFSQLNRWGEPLDSALARLIIDNLTVMAPEASFQMFPCNFAIPLNYQVIVDIIQLDSELSKGILLVAQWSIIDRKNKKMLLTKRSQFVKPINPHNYFGLAQALSEAGTDLASDIAKGLAELPKQPEKNGSGR
ncbi:MAG: PqiC family protein [Candidatus Omnitrophota bacterium]